MAAVRGIEPPPVSMVNMVKTSFLLSIELDKYRSAEGDQIKLLQKHFAKYEQAVSLNKVSPPPQQQQQQQQQQHIHTYHCP